MDTNGALATIQIVLRADGSTEIQTRKTAGPYTLEDMYRLTNSQVIEILEAPQIMGKGSADLQLAFILDEEGKLRGKPVNALATEIAHRLGMIYDFDSIVGDVLAGSVYIDHGEIMPLSAREKAVFSKLLSAQTRVLI